MELQKQPKAPSQSYTDAEQEHKKQIINLIFPSTIIFDHETLSNLRQNLKNNFSLCQHKELLINYSWKNHHSQSAKVYRDFIKEKFPELTQPHLSMYYKKELFLDLKELGEYRSNPSLYLRRHVAPWQDSAFRQLDDIFKQFGYVPALERYFTFFPGFLLRWRSVEKALFQNSKIDQQTTYFLGLCAAVQMGCPYMINRMGIKYLSKGGKIQWIEKKKYPSKIGSVLELNRKLARCMWEVSTEDFDKIEQQGHWNMNQLAFIIQVVSFVHSTCVISLGLGLVPQQKNVLISTEKVEVYINEYRLSKVETGQKPSKKPPLKQVLSALKVIIEEMKTSPQQFQPKSNPKRSFKKDYKNSEQEENIAVETYMKEIGTELTEQKLVSRVLQELGGFLPEYSLIEKRRDNKNNQFTCVDFNFEFRACPRLQSLGLVAESTKKIEALVKESEEMGYQNFGSEMVGSTKQFRKAQRYYAQNLWGFKHPQYDYERLMNKMLPMAMKFYIRLLALSPLHIKRQVLDQVNHEQGQVELFDLGHTALLIAIAKLKLVLTLTTYYFD